MSEQNDIQRLVTWLEGHPGDPPPADLDPEVVEAVYMLRPDLAPAPRVKIEDIFARIETGPLAERSPAEEEDPQGPLASPSEMSRPDPIGLALQTDDIPTELALDRPDPVTGMADSGEVVQLSFYQRHRRNLWTGTGTLAAAAVALFMVLPVRQQAALLGQALHEPAGMSAPAPEPELMRQLLDLPTDDGLEAADTADAANEIGELKKAIEDVEAKEKMVDKDRTVRAKEVASKVAMEPHEGMLEEMQEQGSAEFSGSGAIGGMDGLGTRGSSGRGGGSAGGAVYGTGSSSFGRAPAPAPPQSAFQAADQDEAETTLDFESAEDDLVVSEAMPRASTVAARGRRQSSREQRAPARKSRARDRADADADAAAPALADAAPAVEAPASAPAEPEPDATSELDAWATRAQVKDYRSDWYTSVLAASLVAEIHEAITLASDAGRYMGAYVPPGVASPNTGAGSDPAAIYEPWIQHADLRVAQDMAWRAADSALRQGQLDRALALVARGRARSSANTPYYAHLLELEGTIRRRKGDLAGALEAWKAAAQLNDARSG